MTTFGEIVEPGSRNAWEDWDENIQNNIQPGLKWLKEFTIPEKIKTFLILEGRHLADNLRTQDKLKLEVVSSIPEANLKLYKAEALDNYILLIKDYNLLFSSEIVELVKHFIITSDDVIAVLTKSLVEYQVQELSTHSCIIRSLSTRKPVSKTLNINFPKLEQPNIISGVAAGALSLRESLNLSGMAVVCYIEQPEEYQVDELQDLLKKLNVVPTKSNQNNNLLNSNLYI